MQAQIQHSEAGPVSRSLPSRLAGCFLTAELRHSRSGRRLAEVFVLSHLLGAVFGILMGLELNKLRGTSDVGVLALWLGSAVFLALPVVLRRTGDLALASLVSFQTLTVAALIGTYEFGGFGSPFLPWLLVSLMAGLFYQSRRMGMVLAIFAVDVAIFFAIVLWRAPPNLLPMQELQPLSWISIAVAMSYMAYMALYYAHITASRTELQLEADRYRAAAADLERARVVGEEVNRNRSLFFSKMSHELRTPLNAIIGYSEILLEECGDDPDTDPQRIADLGRINSTGKHLLSLVSDVLDVDNLENEELTLTLSRFSLGELCDTVVATALPLIERNGNRLVIDCPIRQDEVTSDDKKLRQMLLNLLSNAAKFTHNGTVTLELWVERSRADDRLHVAVRDTGIGIAPETLPNLFEAYMQADVTIYGRFGGTGIGLALTRKFAVLLGGDITATSAPGVGSRFSIDVPAELEAGPQGRSASTRPDETTAKPRAA